MNMETKKKKEWSDYEEEVYEECKLHYRKSKVEKNIKKKGILSKRSRQIDILITDANKTVIVDCKYYNHKVDIKEVESFIGMLGDLEADYGILITEKGYTKSALERAYKNPTHLELDIYSLEELKSCFNGCFGIPYAGKNAVLLLSPFGWCLDITRHEEWICSMYQKGKTIEESMTDFEFAYVNFWIKDTQAKTIEELDKMQMETIKKSEGLTGETTYIHPDNLRKEKYLIRVVKFDEERTELTAFVEFKNFIFFCICFSKMNTIKRNIRKMTEIIEYIIPIGIKQ